MSPRRPKNVVALTPGGNITIEQVLGWLAMFTIPDQHISAGKLMRTWAGNDFDTTLLPSTRQPVHVFQSACRSVETRRRVNGGAEIKVDEIYEDSEKSVYQITRMIRDREHELIEHPKAMRVSFDKRSEAIDVAPLEAEHYEALSGLESAVRDHYDQHTALVPGQKVRAAVRGIMANLGATRVMDRSGVYFVPKDKSGSAKKTLDTLQQILEGLYGGRAELWSCPLANDEGERTMIEKHFQVNIDERVDEQIGKIAGVLQRNSYIRKDMLRNAVQTRKDLGTLHERYSDLLSDSLGGVEHKLGLLDEQLDALLVKADQNGTEVE